ncbi:Sgf29p [Sporobolomyces salmoneus]|uniref:Sgf29p n=1 Tax=Sporobolomyces salmoneus TaxID=183962 RepID=UPI00317270B5
MVSHGDPTQLTAQLRSQLRDYIGFTGAINSTLKSINQIQSELDDDKKPINLVKPRLDKQYDTLEEQANDEMRRIDAAIASLDALMAVQTPMALDNTAIPGSSTKRAGQPTKKRKADTASAAASPAPSALPSPLPSYDTAPLNAPALARSTSAKQAPLLPLPNLQPTGPAVPIPGLPGSTLQQLGIPKKVTIKGRKEALQAQLPLKPGRAIVVRQSKKTLPGEGPGDWIMGRIISSIQGDKNRYAVEDADYNPNDPTPEGGKWNTTLKSIIPLPDKLDERTYPEHPFPSGTSVLALYPETTSFYPAIIDSGPYAVASGTGKNKIKDRIYKIRFEDDGDAIRDVPIELVVVENP